MNKQTRTDWPALSGTGAPDAAVNEESYKFEESVNDMVDELLSERGDTIPDVNSLLADAHRIQTALDSPDLPKLSSSTPENSRSKSEDVDKTPTLSKKPFIDARPASGKTSDPLDEEYQESFASQQETAEMRSELESMSRRINHLETILEGLVSERSNLPNHLERLDLSINRQFTVMNERLNAAIESGMVAAGLQQTSQDASVLAKSATDVIDAIATDLKNPPSQSSQIAQANVISGGKRRVKLIR